MDIFERPIYSSEEVKDRKSDCSMACRWLLEFLGPKKVIEIGTSYGFQLESFVPFSSRTVCVDPMYDWVPDVRKEDGFDSSRTDLQKMQKWRENTELFKEKIDLIVGSSFIVPDDPTNDHLLEGSDILIIDGCHSPSEQVAADYFNFQRFLLPEHYVIFDDMGIGEVNSAVEIVKKDLQEKGKIFKEIKFYDALIMKVC